jgi:hypothetical protein
VWADPYFNLITEIQILISHLLKTFGLHLGGELRVNPSRPLSLHNAAVGAEVVKAAEEAEVSTLILDTLVDANLERPLESNSTALDVLSTSTVRSRPLTCSGTWMGYPGIVFAIHMINGATASCSDELLKWL